MKAASQGVAAAKADLTTTTRRSIGMAIRSLSPKRAGERRQQPDVRLSTGCQACAYLPYKWRILGWTIECSSLTNSSKSTFALSLGALAALGNGQKSESACGKARGGGGLRPLTGNRCPLCAKKRTSRSAVV